MSAQPRIKSHWTVEEYLAAERESTGKSEYIDGMIYDMVGASANHNRITSSVIIQVGAQLQEKDCEIFPSDMRLKTPSGLYAYPDVMAVCGDEDIIHDGNKDTLLNPTVIIEVLSASTERFDRGAKFWHYRSLPSLQDYLLIWQNKPVIERFHPQLNDKWELTVFAGLDSVCELASIGCTLKLADVYQKVIFSTTGNEDGS